MLVWNGCPPGPGETWLPFRRAIYGWGQALAYTIIDEILLEWSWSCSGPCLFLPRLVTMTWERFLRDKSCCANAEADWSTRLWLPLWLASHLLSVVLSLTLPLTIFWFFTQLVCSHGTVPTVSFFERCKILSLSCDSSCFFFSMSSLWLIVPCA